MSKAKELKVEIRYTTPENVLKHWKYFIEGVEKCAEFDVDGRSVDELYNDFISGRYAFWSGFVDGVYSGFIATQVQGDALFVAYNYIKKGTDKEVYFIGLDQLLDKAREKGIKRIVMQTNRYKAFDRRLSPLGWKIASVEFRRNLYD
jgi:hypothetical protein